MALTAREQLSEEIIGLDTAPSTDREHQVLTILDRYRLQSKSGNKSEESGTARESLGRELTQLFANKPSDFDARVRDTIDRYRMQFKQAGREISKERKSVPKEKNGARPGDSQKKSKGGAKTNNITIAHNSEPVAGGPQKRTGARGQCPKCHSMGVVLARSYTNDEYFSCIYCGFQAYRSTLDADLDLPLAAELLSRRFDEKDQEE